MMRTRTGSFAGGVSFAAGFFESFVVSMFCKPNIPIVLGYSGPLGILEFTPSRTLS
jgi:hypothetical protein